MKVQGRGLRVQAESLGFSYDDSSGVLFSGLVLRAKSLVFRCFRFMVEGSRSILGSAMVLQGSQLLTLEDPDWL